MDNMDYGTWTIKYLNEFKILQEKNHKLKMELNNITSSRDRFLGSFKEIFAILGIEFSDPDKLVEEIKKLKNNC